MYSTTKETGQGQSSSSLHGTAPYTSVTSRACHNNYNNSSITNIRSEQVKQDKLICATYKLCNMLSIHKLFNTQNKLLPDV